MLMGGSHLQISEDACRYLKMPVDISYLLPLGPHHYHKKQSGRFLFSLITRFITLVQN